MTTDLTTFPPTAISVASCGEGVIPQDDNEMHFYELALKASAAVQASRWTRIKDGTGYIASFQRTAFAFFRHYSFATRFRAWTYTRRSA